MSTNYYVVFNKCKCCGRHDLQHIGKYSGGEFFFHSPNKEITTWQQWRTMLQGEEIQDEYGRTVDLAAFVQKVESAPNRGEQHNCDQIHDARNCWLDPEGYSFCNWEFS